MCSRSSFAASELFAQPATWTSGASSGTFSIQMESLQTQSIDFDLTGADFRFVGMVDGSWNVTPANECVTGGSCRPGATIQLDANVSGTALGQGIAIVNDDQLSPAFFSGSFVFDAGAATIPRSNRKRVMLTVPFTLVPGQLLILPDASSRELGTNVWASGTASGSGLATLVLERERIDREVFYIARRVVYTFGID